MKHLLNNSDLKQMSDIGDQNHNLDSTDLQDQVFAVLKNEFYLHRSNQ